MSLWQASPTPMSRSFEVGDLSHNIMLSLHVEIVYRASPFRFLLRKGRPKPVACFWSESERNPNFSEGPEAASDEKSEANARRRDQARDLTFDRTLIDEMSFQTFESEDSSFTRLATNRITKPTFFRSCCGASDVCSRVLTPCRCCDGQMSHTPRARGSHPRRRATPCCPTALCQWPESGPAGNS